MDDTIIIDINNSNFCAIIQGLAWNIPIKIIVNNKYYFYFTDMHDLFHHIKDIKEENNKINT